MLGGLCTVHIFPYNSQIGIFSRVKRYFILRRERKTIVSLISYYKPGQF